MQTKSPRTAESEHAQTQRRAARIRLALIAAAVVAIAAFAVAIFLALEKESVHERWDLLEQLRNEYEPAQDPIWENPYGVYNPERERYIAALEKFLDTKAKEDADALEPHTRFMIAKTIADHILSNPEMLDLEARARFYEKALAQLEAIRDDFPDFPLNWTRLSPEGYPSLTRQFIDWLKKNQAWEQAHVLRPHEPAADVRVLVRTERGDMLLGLYLEQAPRWTAAFLERATKGFYDGTAFMVKEEVGDVSDPEKHFVVGGSGATRDAPPFDAKRHDETAGVKVRGSLLPDEARNLIPHERGIVAAWHPADTEYDAEEPFLVVVRRSTALDYNYTPVGKLLDEHGLTSLRTLDRIFGGVTWREDREVREDTTLGGILDYLQAPVKIVKVLVYDEGTLRDPGTDALPSRTSVEESEKSLSTIQADRYKVEPPVRPEEPGERDDGDGEGEADPGEGDAGGDDADDADDAGGDEDEETDGGQ